MTRRLILLGDSIFDNGAYVGAGEKDVAAHLRARLPADEWTVELRAVDGAVVGDVPAQLDRAAVDSPGIFVLSAGGNDALGCVGMLSDPTPYTIADVLAQFYGIKESFREAYVAALDRILAHGLPTIACSIYNPRFDEAVLQRTAEAALSIFNDVIVQEAMIRLVPIIDLRIVCSEAADFANPIEASHRGGARIAEAIVSALARYAPLTRPSPASR
jgi:lysophospholipase L1-like esterase